MQRKILENFARKKETLKTISIVTIFAIAMAFLESVFVYYIRMIRYPKGFNFYSINSLSSEILNIEMFRELSTLIILFIVAILVAKGFYKRFAYFLYAFAIWDIFYYVWLKVVIGWPNSLLNWDILFLIPWSWSSPVLAPIICSLNMIILAFSILFISDKKYKFKIKIREWILLFIGGFLQLYTFLYDYGKIMIRGDYLNYFSSLMTNEKFILEVTNYMPTHYNWTIFLIGEILILTAIASWHFRYKK